MKVKITSHCSKFSLLLNCLLFSVQFSFAQTPASSNLSKSVLACNLPPIITCPSNITVSPGASSDPAAFGCAKALPGAVGCNQPIVSHIDRVTSTGPCIGEETIQRIWTAADPEDPTVRSFCIQYISKADKTAPVFQNCPKDTSILSNEKCAARFAWIAPWVTDESGNFTVTASHINGDQYPLGETIIQFTATDDCGNSSICSFKLTVINNCCSAPPVLHCPADFSSCLDSGVDPLTTGRASASSTSPVCANPIISYVDRTVISQNCITRIERTWTATDPNINTLTTSCIQLIQLKDDTGPVFSGCPSDQNLIGRMPDCTIAANWTAPTASDLCPGAVRIQSTHASGSIFGKGTTTVVYTATDACGNTTTCSFNINVTGNCLILPPVIQCPSEYTACPNGSRNPLVTGTATVTGTTNPTISYVDRDVYIDLCSSRIERKWIAIDPVNSLRDSCYQILTYKDKKGPTFTFCPSDFSIDPSGDCIGMPMWSEPIATDDCSSVFLSSNYRSGSKFGLGNTLVIYTATDDCGNTTSCWFTVTVNDNCCNKPPQITCPTEYRACPNTSILPDVTGRPTVVLGNPRCNTADLSYSDETIFTSNCSLRVMRTWLAVDPNNNTLRASCTQLIDLSDHVVPVFANCPVDFTINPGPNCIATPTWTEPQVSDNCPGTIDLSSNYRSGSSFGIGNTLVVYTASDACGNTSTCWFTITVNDNCCNLPPRITCPTEYRGCPNTSILPEVTGRPTTTNGHVTCRNPNISYVDQTIFTSNCSLRILRKWLAVDPDNAALRDSCTQVIDLSDRVSPVFANCPVDVTVDPGPNCIATPTWVEPTASDNCLGTVTISSNFRPGANFGLGNTLVVYTASDACGNTSTCWFTITVNNNCCNLPPRITCPTEYRGCPNTSVLPEVTGRPTTTNGHVTCRNPNISYVDQTIFTSNCSLRILRKWLAVDPDNASLRDSCTQVIDLSDRVSPVFANCPVDFTINPAYDCIALVPWTPPTVTDNCGTVNLSSNFLPGASLPRGNTLVVYTATDACGNTASCWFTVTVTDNCCDRNPIITCPAAFVDCPGVSIDPSNTGRATAVKGKPTCEDPIVSYRDSILTNGPCLGATKIIRIWTAQDPIISSLRSVCHQLIELKDISRPRFTSTPPNQTIDANGDCEVEVFWTPPVATDNCGIASISSTHRPGDLFTSGVTTVKYVATDHCGLKDSVSFTITITGNEIHLFCPNDTMIARKDPYLPGEVVCWNLPTAHYCKPCPDSIAGFIYMGEYKGHRYFCSRAPESWENARIQCQLIGGRLASINDAGENAYVASKLMGLTAWIGGTDKINEGTFGWDNRDPFIYRNWLAGQPDNAGNQDYIEMRPDGKWNDQFEHISNEFICEIPCYELRQIEGPERCSLVPCGTNRITYVATKDGVNDTCSFNVVVKCDSSSLYCEARALSSSYTWIDNVRFAGIDNTSGANGGYHLFQSPCGAITAGNNYSISLNPGYSGVTYNVYWRVWIDYNADSLWNNTTELVAQGSGVSVMNGMISIPNGLSADRVRMRVSMAYGGYPIASCSSFLHGEVEDYCISINGGLTGGSNNGLKTNTTTILNCVQNCDQSVTDQIPGVTIENKGDLEFGNLSSMSLYPNPADELIKIEVANAMFNNVQIFDAKGKLVFSKTYNDFGFEKMISTRNLNNGVYHVLVNTQKGEKITKRFSIQH
ncbi:MAG: HYR domain-containing protein [Saprospiraceae bacterium]